MKRTAFTLLELLIVLAILIVLIGILGNTIWSAYENALIRATEVQLKNFDEAIASFQLDNKTYPTSAEGLDILVGKVNAVQNQNAGMNNPNAGMGMNQGMNDPNAGMGMNQGMNNPNAGMGMNPQGNNAAPTAVQTPVRRTTRKYMDLKEIPLDAWGNAYKYEWPTNKGNGKKPAIWSFGPDKEDNQGAPGSDDIINWDPTETPAVQQQNQMGMNNPMGMNGAMNDPNMQNMNGAMGNQGMMPQNMNGGMNDPNMQNMNGAMGNQGMMPQNMNGAMNDPNMQNMNGAMGNQGMMPQNMNGGMNNPNMQNMNGGNQMMPQNPGGMPTNPVQ